MQAVCRQKVFALSIPRGSSLGIFDTKKKKKKRERKKHCL